ncbi:HAD family hydrolase [Paenibacillus methanolicus]|nr:HAD family hydrolase [Paenibacillus methanolicus]
MKGSIIALDLDGTLLGSDKRVSARNAAAVLACHRAGKRIVIATARPPRSVTELLPVELLGISSFVFYNGALIRDTQSGIEEHLPIEADVTAELLDYCGRHMAECHISMEVNDAWFANRDLDDPGFYHSKFKPTIRPLSELRLQAATKVLLTSFREADAIAQAFAERANVVLTDGGRLLQIMNKSVSKAAGLLRLCVHYGVPASEIVAFGDDMNDVDMLQMAGYGVAMGNAVPLLKSAARHVTGTNDEDGVAAVLERLA